MEEVDIKGKIRDTTSQNTNKCNGITIHLNKKINHDGTAEMFFEFTEGWFKKFFTTHWFLNRSQTISAHATGELAEIKICWIIQTCLLAHKHIWYQKCNNIYPVQRKTIIWKIKSLRQIISSSVSDPALFR